MDKDDILALIAARLRADNEQLLWLAGDAGGLKIQYGGTSITVLTPKSPLGAALIGKAAGDELEISIAGEERCYEVCAVY